MATQVAREGFSFTSKDGLPRIFRAGDLIDSSDPDFKGREHLFQSADDAADESSQRRGTHPARAAETASAAPGEQRVRSSKLPTTPPAVK